MPITDEKKRMIEHVVYDRFNPLLKLEVTRLIAATLSQTIKNYNVSELFGGVNIVVDDTPQTFHIGALSKDLVKNLTVIFDDENGNPKKKKEDTETRRNM